MRKFLDFWTFGVLDFFGCLGFTVVFPICRNRSKIGFGKRQRLRRYLQCFRGVRVVWGGDHIYIHMYTSTHTHKCMHVCVCAFCAFDYLFFFQHFSGVVYTYNNAGIIFVCANVHLYEYIYIYTYVYSVYTRIHTTVRANYVYAHTQTYIHIYI